MREFSTNKDRILIGAISDTHGLLRPEAVIALEGVELIIHAGDIGSPRILNELRDVSPVVAVRGNMDGGAFGLSLPETETVCVGTCLIHVLHDLHRLTSNPKSAGIGLIISGHTHEPRLHSINGVMYLNPGSAGPRRFDLPITLARVTVAGASISVQHIDLEQIEPAVAGSDCR